MPSKVAFAVGLVLWTIASMSGQNQKCPSPITPPPEVIISINKLIDKARIGHPDVQRALVWALVWQESRYDPNAKGDYSEKGQKCIAVGLGQIHPDTAAGIENHLNVKLKDREDPEQTVPALIAYLSDLLQKRRNDETLALANYQLNDKELDILYLRSKEGLALANYHLGDCNFEFYKRGKRAPKCPEPDQKSLEAIRKTPSYINRIRVLEKFTLKIVDPYIDAISSEEANLRIVAAQNETIHRLEEENRSIQSDSSGSNQIRRAELEEQLRAAEAQKQAAMRDNEVLAQKESELRNELEKQQEIIRQKDALIEEKDAQVQKLADELELSKQENAGLKKEYEEALRKPANIEGIQKLKDRLAESEAKNQNLKAQLDAFQSRLDAQDAYYQNQAAELKRQVESQFTDLRSLGERLKVIQPPPLPFDVRLCMPGTLANPDEDLLNTGSLLLAYLENGEALDLPHVFSYSYRTASSYSRSDIEPMAGDYVGAAATGDRLSLTIGPNRLLTNFQTSLKSQTHRGRMTLIPPWLQDKPCPFERGLMSAYLPNEDYFTFLIVRVSSPRDLVGYVLTRANSSEQIVVVQFAAKWIGR